MTAIPMIPPQNRRRPAAIRLWPSMIAVTSAAAAATLLGGTLLTLPAYAQQQQQSGQQRRSPAGQPGRLPDGRPIGPDSTRPGPPSSRRPGAAGDPAGTRRSPTTPDNGVGAGRTVPQVPPGDASGRTGLTPATSGTARNRSTGTRSGVRTSTGRDQQRRQQVGQRRRRSDSTRRKQTGRASQRAGRSTGRSNVQHSRPGR
jgi:hypothetical protein